MSNHLVKKSHVPRRDSRDLAKKSHDQPTNPDLPGDFMKMSTVQHKDNNNNNNNNNKNVGADDLEMAKKQSIAQIASTNANTPLVQRSSTSSKSRVPAQPPKITKITEAHRRNEISKPQQQVTPSTSQ